MGRYGLSHLERESWDRCCAPKMGSHRARLAFFFAKNYAEGGERGRKIRYCVANSRKEDSCSRLISKSGHPLIPPPSPSPRRPTTTALDAWRSMRNAQCITRRRGTTTVLHFNEHRLPNAPRNSSSQTEPVTVPTWLLFPPHVRSFSCGVTRGLSLLFQTREYAIETCSGDAPRSEWSQSLIPNSWGFQNLVPTCRAQGPRQSVLSTGRMHAADGSPTFFFLTRQSPPQILQIILMTSEICSLWLTWSRARTSPQFLRYAWGDCC